MNSNNNYFSLFSCCVPVKGKDKSLIYDFQRQVFHEINNDLCELLPFINKVSLQEIENSNNKLYKTVCELEEKEIGFFTVNPELFPPISTKWDTACKITDAVVEVSNETNYDIETTLRNIRELNCSAVALVIKDKYVDVDAILNVLQKYEFYYVALYFEFKLGYVNLRRLVTRFEIIRSVTCFNAKVKRRLYKNTPINYYSYSSHMEFCKNESCEIILEHKLYCESLLYNNCLNRKIAINYLGEIKNCLHTEECFGQCKKDNLDEVIETKEFQKLWYVAKDNVEGCKDCEYRYACKDCRAFNNGGVDIYTKPLNCENPL